MSHFTYPRSRRTSEQQVLNSVILTDNILDSERPIISDINTPYSSSENNSVVSLVESSDSSTILASRQPARTQTQPVEERRCWICFGDSTDSQGKWVKPCKCSLEAHQSCLLDWIAENQKASPNKKVNCPQCATTYHLAEQANIPLALMSVLDSCIKITTPYITVVGLGCSLLLTCTTYGAFSVMTFFGVRDGERLIGNPNDWTYKTWVGLPLIPLLLISSKTKFGDAILPIASVTLLRAIGISPSNIRLTWPLSPALTIGLMPWVRLFYKNVYRLVLAGVMKKLSIKRNSTNTTLESLSDRRSSNANETPDRERSVEYDMITGGNPNLRSVGFAIVGSLLWPVLSSSIGELLYRFKWVKQNFPEPFQRSTLGGCLFIVAKDIGNLIYRYQRIRQYRSRRVQSYEEVLKSMPRS